MDKGRPAVADLMANISAALVGRAGALCGDVHEVILREIPELRGDQPVPTLLAASVHGNIDACLRVMQYRIDLAKVNAPAAAEEYAATGAVAAAVSMMTDTFLGVESTNDQPAARLAGERARLDANRRQEEEAIHGRLVSVGFSDSDAETVIGIVGKHPETGLKIAAAVDLGVGEATR